MHLQIVNFNLNGLPEGDYKRHCENVAANFAELPGLLSKFWLSSPESNTFGGVYLWRDQESFEQYVRSETFAGLQANPYLSNLTSRDFDILEAPSEITRAFLFSRTG